MFASRVVLSRTILWALTEMFHSGYYGQNCPLCFFQRSREILQEEEEDKNETEKKCEQKKKIAKTNTRKIFPLPMDMRVSVYRADMFMPSFSSSVFF